MNDSRQIRTTEGTFAPPDLQIRHWEDVAPYFHDLLERPLLDSGAVEQWISDKSQLDAVISEFFAWLYIRITLNSKDQPALDAYHHAVKHISPRIASMENELNEKLVNCPFTSSLDPEVYHIHLRKVHNAVSLFNENSIPLNTEVQLKSKEYGRIFSQMTIGMDGRQMTLQKASTLLEEKNRSKRKQVYIKINQRILQDTEELENLFDDLLHSRHEIARNAGFDNYRDYAFRALDRFDYSPQDCEHFHDSILREIVPLLDEIYQNRKTSLGLSTLRPWDLNIDTRGVAPLHPAQDSKELLQKGIRCLNRVHPEFGKVLQIMDHKGHLDLESRPGKRPGGYNMPLPITGLPFLFMNATNSFGDLRTLMHESGHAIHAYLTKGITLSTARRFPPEISELAAMTMELLTLEHWNVFFPDKEDLRRARIGQLENVLKVLPWIATIDKFQHWLYTNPFHSPEERKAAWMRIFFEFSSKVVDYSGLEKYIEFIWHKQLHLFEVPFYYVEYGFAQLGAIAIWQRYHHAPQQAVNDYVAAMQLGYSQPIPQVYRAAGIEFDFSSGYVHQLGNFVRKQLEDLL